MKHLFKFYCISAFLLTFFHLNAQTHHGGFVVRIAGNTTDWKEGECGWGGANGWGGTIDKDTCASFVWLYDQPGGQVDSLGCDNVINDYTGKWVLIRRGVCEFGVKAYKAQLAGAAGVIILNHNSSIVEDDCTIIEIGPGGTGFQVSIPAIFASRKMGEALQTAILNGNGVGEVCFRVHRVYEPYTSWHYATPISQVDTISTIAIRLLNRGFNDLNGIVVKADIENPAGQVTALTKTIDLPANTDQLVVFDKYLPQGGVGLYKVAFSASGFTDPQDTVRTSFLITKYTFSHAVIPLDPDGVGPSNEQFAMCSFQIQSGGFCMTGPNGGRATHVTFGISNVATVATPDPAANIVGIVLYDADANNDGAVDLINSFDDLNISGVVGTCAYIIEPSLPNDSLVSIAIQDTSGLWGVSLKPKHLYCVSLLYDGTLAGLGVPLRFSSTPSYNYFNILNDAGGQTSMTPVFLFELFDGYEEEEIIERLELEGFIPGSGFGASNTRPTPLSASKFKITPNPATDFLKLDLNLDTVNVGVSVSLMDYNGRTVQTQTAKNFQNGQFRFDTTLLPSGNYLLWINTGEGSAARPVAICH